MRIWLCGCMSTASGWNSCFDAYILALVSDGAPSNLKLSRWLLESLPPNTLLVHHLCDLQLPQEWSCVSVKMGLVGIMMMIHYGSYGSGIGIAIAIADHSCRNQFLFIDSLILWYDITFDMISFWYLKFAGFYKISIILAYHHIKLCQTGTKQTTVWKLFGQDWAWIHWPLLNKLEEFFFLVGGLVNWSCGPALNS